MANDGRKGTPTPSRELDELSEMAVTLKDTEGICNKAVEHGLISEKDRETCVANVKKLANDVEDLLEIMR